VKPRPALPLGPYLVVGLARSGVAAALALRAKGEGVLGVDARTPTLPGVLADAGVELHLREEGVELLERVGAVIKSPGVPREAPVIAAAHARGLPVLGELELGWRLLENEFVAVTGTNGKTTTVELIGHIHRQAGAPVAVAGNVGAPLSGLAGVLGRETVVCEVSSFQLEDTLAFAPEAAVLLNLAPDHLDRHGTFERYAAAKLQIFARQGPADIAVLPADLDALDPSDPRLAAQRVRFGEGAGTELSERDGKLWWQAGEGPPRDLLAVSELRLRGAHNLHNAMAAGAVCLARGIDAEAVRAGLRSFAGVAHRLEEVAHREGVLYVNDSKATNVSSTLVALEAFSDAAALEAFSDAAGHVHLILGGQGKGQDFVPLRAAVERVCRAAYLIGEDAPALARALAGGRTPTHECGELEQAVAMAEREAVPGEVVLLSPACASFDQFADFEARWERFRELVAALAPHR
jgi:UDP-N-acetylmuramoylalanine--D-glutamate ligase